MRTPKEVPPHEIESELTRIWETLKGHENWRTSLFNLILYGRKDSRMDYNITLAKSVISSFPSRILSIIIDPDLADSDIKTSVSVIQTGAIACDYIEIRAGLAQEQRIPFLIYAHLLSDLPVYLFWSQDICSSSSAPLENIAKRLILDSETTDDILCFAKTALDHYHKTPAGIADLNWARMESWRTLLLSTFYSETQLAHLTKTKEIRITYNAQTSTTCHHPHIQALYLQAWLASRLDWAYQTHSDHTFHYTANGSPLTITLIPQPQPHLSGGTLIQLDLFTHEGVEYHLTRAPSSPHQITLEITTPTQCYLPSQFIFSQGYAGGSLVKEITHKGTSAHYLDALQLITTYQTLS